MEKKFETKYGEITLRGAMIDINGTDLCDGVEIKLDDELIGETTSSTFSHVEDLETEEVEAFVEKYADL